MEKLLGRTFDSTAHLHGMSGLSPIGEQNGMHTGMMNIPTTAVVMN